MAVLRYLHVAAADGPGNVALPRTSGVCDARVGAWFNHRRLLEPIGYVPPVEHEEEYDRRKQAPVALAGVR